MFYASYQNGQFLEIFDSKRIHNKIESDRMSQYLLKIHGQNHVKKKHDKLLKTDVYCIESNGPSKL